MSKQADFIRPDPDPRELTFVPADAGTAKTLRGDLVERFNSDGFIGGLPVFDVAESADVRRYITGLVDEVTAAPDHRDSYSINAYHLVCRGLYDLARTPVILDYVTDLLGPDVVCWGTTVFCKLPYDPKEVPLHQDAAYWPFTPTKTVTAWLSIDGADEENSAVRFVPGSHLLGALEHEDLALDGTRVRKRQVVAPDRYPDRYPNVLAPGEVSLHADLLLHGSAPNRSARRRTGLTIRYAAAEVHTLPGWEWWYGGGIHCRGTIGAHWPDRRRPSGEHPHLMERLAAANGTAPDGG
jgi:hypothetical protein